MADSFKERGMLFTAPMVRAILDSSKTQTRRVVKPIPQMVTESNIATWDGDAAALMRLFDQVGRGCPYGHSGDRLWVRETWQGYRQTNYEYDEWEEMESPKDRHDNTYVPVYRADDKSYPEKWLPAIHMPREFSRINLEITGVRVERLQDISEADAAAEGIAPNWIGSDLTGWDPNQHGYLPHDCDAEGDVPGVDIYDDCWTAKRCFQRLWESINGAGSWAANPWVWVIEFRRIK